MEITEVRIKLTEDSDDRLQGFCSITFDNCFVVRDLKIIEGSSGPFVAMPSRKLTFHCPKCNTKNHLRASYCNHCGHRFRREESPVQSEGKVKLYADIAHPINSACREMIQKRVIDTYREELERAARPDYVSNYDDEYFDDDWDEYSSDQSGGSDSSTRVESAEKPRGPHRRQSEQSSEKRSGGFGEGIFDE